MRTQKITLVQSLVNKTYWLKDFSYDKNNNSYNLDKSYNYIVGTENIYTGKNPSLDFDLNLKIGEILKNSFDIIGGWFDKEANIYYLDNCVKIYDLQIAINIAKINNQKSIFDIQNNKVINL